MDAKSIQAAVKQRRKILSKKGKAVILKLLQRNRVSLTFRYIYRFAINGCQVCSSRREAKKKDSFKERKSGYPQAPARKPSSLDLPLHVSLRDKWMPRRFRPLQSEEGMNCFFPNKKRLPSYESSRSIQCAVLSAFSRLSAYKSSYSTMRLMVSVNSKYCSRLA